MIAGRRLLGAGLAVVVAGLALAGCGGGGDSPRTLPPLSTTPVSTSLTPIPTPTGPTAASAEAFVRKVFADINHALATGDTKAYRADLAKSCDCFSLAETIEQVYRNGRYVGAAYDVDTVRVDAVEPRVAAVQVVFHNPAARRLDKNGRVVDTLAPRRSRTAVYSLGRASLGWTVLTVKYLDS